MGGSTRSSVSSRSSDVCSSDLSCHSESTHDLVNCQCETPWVACAKHKQALEDTRRSKRKSLDTRERKEVEHTPLKRSRTCMLRLMPGEKKLERSGVNPHF